MLAKYAANWYAFPDVAQASGLSDRALRTRLASVPQTLVREETALRGRPRKLYHYTAIPELSAHHALRGIGSAVPAVASSASIAPAADDLATAELRLQAVMEYDALCVQQPKDAAANDVAAAWRRRPRTRTVKVSERLGAHTRTRTETVTVGKFSPKTLRRWHALYMNARARGTAAPGNADVPVGSSVAAASILALAPVRKNSVGRRRVDIPEDDLNFVRLSAVSTARADVAKAVALAEPHLSPEARAVSLATWRRRLNELDPRKGLKALMHSRSRYRAGHTPDIEIDWAKLPYNGRWELDDVQKDWYAYSSEMDRLIRPYGYAIIRVRTRQWVAFAASETPPTHPNVRELLGFAMSSPFGGIPDVLKFERGTVACPPEFEELLISLGIRVSRTSMDGGSALPGQIADRASGHFQGKGVVERNFRNIHEREWMERNQVGPDERITAPARTERIKALAAQAAAEGKFLMARSPDEWYPVFSRTMELHNNRPHSALPKIIDPETGKTRHMTPNEQAVALGDSPIRLLDERLLPRFVNKAEIIPVTRNGILLNNRHYGRFDEDLQRHAKVAVFASKDFPAVAYVQELGRCLRAYEKSEPGDFSRFEDKRRREKKFRNQAEALQARVIESGKPGVFDLLIAAGNPTPERLVSETVCPPELLAQASGLETGIRQYRDAARLSAKRFELGPAPLGTPTSPSAPLGTPTFPSASTPKRTGILAKAEALSDQLDTLGRDSQHNSEEEPLW